MNRLINRVRIWRNRVGCCWWCESDTGCTRTECQCHDTRDWPVIVGILVVLALIAAGGVWAAGEVFWSGS